MLNFVIANFNGAQLKHQERNENAEFHNSQFEWCQNINIKNKKEIHSLSYHITRVIRSSIMPLLSDERLGVSKSRV